MSQTIESPLKMMVEQLISELEQSFGDVKSVQKAVKQYRNGGSNETKFAQSLKSHVKAINEKRDVHVFGIPWHLCSESSREAIFLHLQSIVMFGGALDNLPTNTLGAIEDLAAKCAKEIKGPPTIENVLSVVQKNAGLLQDVFKELGVPTGDMVQEPPRITQEE